MSKKYRDPLEESMGLRPPQQINYDLLAKNLRRLCKGAFGKMSVKAYNNRVLGTSGAERYGNSSE